MRSWELRADGGWTNAIPFAGLAVILLLVALGGGGARADLQSLLYVRPAAVVLLALILARKGVAANVGQSHVILFLAVWAALMVLQLVPLPPQLWAGLPGRDLFAEGARIAGLEDHWRPLTLSPDATLNSLVAMTVPLAAATAAACLPRPHWPKLMWLTLGLVLVSGLLGMLQAAAGASSNLYLYAITNEGAGVGLFSNRNHQAFFLNMGIPLLFWAYRRYRGRSDRFRPSLLGASLLFILVSIWATGSRAGLAISLLVLPAALFALTPELLRQSKLRIAAFVLGLAAFGVLAMGSSGLRVFDRVGSLAPQDDLRFVLFGDFMRMAGTYFPAGAGFGTFEGAYQVFEPESSLSERYVNHAHMDWLEIAIEGGLPAIVLAVLFATWWLRAAVTVLRKESKELRAPVLVTLVPLLASLTDYPLRTPFLAAVFAIYLIAMEKQTRSGGINSSDGDAKRLRSRQK